LFFKLSVVKPGKMFHVIVFFHCLSTDPVKMVKKTKKLALAC